MDGMSREEMEKAIKVVIDNQEFLEASMKPIAQLLYAKMKSLMDAGFSRQEALELVKARGLNA